MAAQINTKLSLVETLLDLYASLVKLLLVCISTLALMFDPFSEVLLDKKLI